MHLDDALFIIDVLEYAKHGDPQLRGQAALLASSMLKCLANGYNISTVEDAKLFNIINDTLADKETTASRLALQSLELCLPYVLESELCSKIVPSLNSLVMLSANPYWLIKVDLLDILGSISWISLEFGLCRSELSVSMLQKALFSKWNQLILSRAIGN